MTEFVYKYPLLVGETTAIALPDGAHILDVAAQGGEVCLWARVDEDEAGHLCRPNRTFLVIGTGHNLPNGDAHTHVGTAHTSGGFVWHAFEVHCAAPPAPSPHYSPEQAPFAVGDDVLVCINGHDHTTQVVGLFGAFARLNITIGKYGTHIVQRIDKIRRPQL